MKLGEITQPLVELLGDAEQAENYLDGHDSPFFRRAYVRSTMAAIEAIVWFLKQTCVKAAAGSRSALNVAEYAILSDATYELKNNGEVKVQTKFLKLPDNVRFAIKTCNRLFGTTVDLQVGSTSWQEFLTAIEVRNRITHPKDTADLQVSDNEIEVCKCVSGWFNQRIADFIFGIAKQSGVTETVTALPDAEQSHALEPAAGPDSNGESSPPAQ